MSTFDYSADDILDAQFGSSHSSQFPSTYYGALLTAAPTDAGGGTEGGYPEYARSAVTNIDANFPPASGREKTHANPIVFPTPSIDTPDFTVFAWYRHVTADQGLSWMYLPVPVSALAGKQLFVPVGAWTRSIP